MINTFVPTGRKDDKDKNRLDLIEPAFIEGVGEVLTHGAQKYSANSWQNVEDAENRYYAALLRHILAWRAGEAVDKESGLSHLKHAACNLMFLLHFEQENK